MDNTDAKTNGLRVQSRYNNEDELLQTAEINLERAESLIRCMRFSIYEDEWHNKSADFDNLLGILAQSIYESRTILNDREIRRGL